MTRHHPDSLSLMEYSAGNLSEPHALCIRLHLDQCPHCRSRVDTLNSLGAVMMDQQPKVTVADTSFEQLMSRIDNVPFDNSPTAHAPRTSPLNKLLGQDINELPWKRQLGDVSILDISEKFPGQAERVVLQKLVAGGKSTKEIAFLLNLSVKTVETHRAQIMERLGIRDVAGLVRYALRTGLVPPEG